MNKKAAVDSCKCSACKGACEYKPGWFTPGEAEKAAELLGMDMPSFFKTKLMVDWFENGSGSAGARAGKNVFVLSPALVGEEVGTEAPVDPRGKCVFFKRGQCEIHSAKPFECRMMIHDEPHGASHVRHLVAAKFWVKHQRQIRELLGRKPEAKEYSGGGFMGMILRSIFN